MLLASFFTSFHFFVGISILYRVKGQFKELLFKQYFVYYIPYVWYFDLKDRYHKGLVRSMC